jgi:hypothetical protein
MSSGDFIGDDLSGIHTCHAGCPCQNRATGEADKARKCEMCDGTGHVWDGPEGENNE